MSHAQEQQRRPVKAVSRFVTWAGAALLILLIGYLATYLLAGKKLTGYGSPSGGYGFMESIALLPGHPLPPPFTAVKRQFRSPLEARWFIPLAWLEAKVTRRTVLLAQQHPVSTAYPWGIEILNPVYEP